MHTRETKSTIFQKKIACSRQLSCNFPHKMFTSGIRGPRADFDIFSQGVGGLARGVRNFSPLTLLTRRRCAAPCSHQAIVIYFKIAGHS